MTSVALQRKVDDFFAQKRLAVAGVSRNVSHHPVGNLIYGRLRETGHDVFPVNPNMTSFEGDPCFPDVQSIPGGRRWGGHCHAARNDGAYHEGLRASWCQTSLDALLIRQRIERV